MARRARHSTCDSRFDPKATGRPLYVTPAPDGVDGAWFDQAAVDRVVLALRALRHTKGRWAGSAFELEPWQLGWIIAPIFGWKHPDGTRIVRTAWVEIPRKNGKSTLASGLALVLLCADGESGAEVYSAAASRDQARIVFEEAKKMARGTPALAGKLKLMANTISVPATGGVYRALSKLAEVAHGLNVHGAVVDEVHVHRSRDLVDALETGTGAREQPLVLFITTADEGDETTIYAEKHQRTVQLAERVFDDPSFYGVIWAAAETDDPYDERTWRRANPGLGTTVKVEYFRKEAQRAQTSPAYFATFCRLLLNRRVRTVARYLHLADWDATAGLVSEEALVGRACYAGLDLASTTDIAALSLVFPGDEGYDVLSYFWVPGDHLLERARKDRVPYDVWDRMGLLTATEGNVIDYAAIRKTIGELGKRFDIREIAYDRWNASSIVTELGGDGFICIPMGQGFASMAAPTKELLTLVLSKRLRHGGNPVLRWMADNLVVRTDPAGNVKPDKAKSRERVDGMVALIMAIDRAIRNDRSPSRYESEGLLVLG